MMKNVKLCMALLFCLSVVACSPKITTVYYYSDSKTNDGEIFGQFLRDFFSQDRGVRTYQIHSNVLDEELQKIKDSIKIVPSSQELDDGYYGYAFITNSRDTLYAGHQMNYWRYNHNVIPYNSKIIKALVDSKVSK